MLHENHSQSFIITKKTITDRLPVDENTGNGVNGEFGNKWDKNEINIRRFIKKIKEKWLHLSLLRLQTFNGYWRRRIFISIKSNVSVSRDRFFYKNKLNHAFFNTVNYFYIFAAWTTLPICFWTT